MTKVSFDVTAASDWEAGSGYSQVVAALLERDARHAGNDYVCPTHSDRRPSLGVVDRNGRVLMHCSAGCDTTDIMKALGLGMSVLANGGGSSARKTPRPAEALPGEESIARWAAALTGDVLSYWTTRRSVDSAVLEQYEIGWNPSAASIDGSGRKGAYVFPYRDARGTLLNVKRRWQESNGHKKTFRLNSGAPTDFLWPADQMGYGALMLVEGEPDALRLIGLGIPAVTGVTGVGGSAKSARVYAPSLAGKRVFIAFDSSKAGRGAATEVAAIVAEYADAVYVWDPFPDRADDSDVSDWLTFYGDDVRRLKRELAALSPLEPVGGGSGDDGGSGGLPDRSTLFVDGAFNPPALGMAAQRAGRLRVGPGGALWRYKDGCYIEDDRWVDRFVGATLREEFRDHRMREVRSYCKATSPSIPMHPDARYINCRNGLYVRKTERLEAHSPDIPLVLRIGAEYVPGAGCASIDKFLGMVLPPNCVEWFWEWVGYLLIPTSKYQRALMVTGPADTGKSTLLRLVGAFLGDVAVSHHSLQALCDDRFAKADLFGKLANIHADIDARSIQSSGTMKVLISGDPITVERKYGHPFSFSSYARHMYSANEMPGTSDQSDAYYKRWFVLPMVKKVSVKRQQPLLEARLTQSGELSGMLNRALAGLERLESRRRFLVPGVMDEALKAYRQDTDTVLGWAGERIVWSGLPGDQVRLMHAYEDYVVWCATNGKRAYGRPKFAKHFVDNYEHPVQVGNPHGVVVWRGVKLDG